MDERAEQEEKRKVGSIFIYTHEAHPGEKMGHHTSLEQKIEHARAFRDHYSLKRPLYVDRLDGKCHRYFGSMPNMAWILSRSGQVIYKADWTDVHSITSCIDDFFAAEARRRDSRLASAPFKVERLEFRQKNKSEFVDHLREIAGEKAVEEYLSEYGSQ